MQASSTCSRSFTRGSVAAALLALLALGSACAAQKAEPAPKSQLAGIPLPERGQRITEKSVIDQISPKLDLMAAKVQKRSAFAEVLVWPRECNRAAIIGAVADAMKKAEYTYQDQEIKDESVPEARALAAEKPGKQITGFWIGAQDYTLLAWCQLLDPKLDAISSKALQPTSGAVLVPGDPALTQEMVSNAHRLMEWALDAPLTRAQRDEMQQAFVEAWKTKNRTQIASVQELLKMHDKVMALPEDKRSILLPKAQPELIRGWRQNTNDETARWAVAIYDAAHKPIAAGDPPLTRQVCDAYTELIAFMVGEVSGKAPAATPQGKDATAKALVAFYGKLTPSQQLQLARIPMVWAAIRTAWPNVSEDERAKSRGDWAGLLAKLVPQQQQTSSAAAKAMREMDAMLPGAKNGTITTAEMRYVADRMDILAVEQRKLGGEKNAAGADQWAELARNYREEADAAAAGKGSESLKQTADRLFAEEMRRHNAYVGLTNAALTSHAGTLNMISIMSGSPCRYSVR